MKRYTRIDPMEFPLRSSESWWVVHPNNSRCSFRIPSGAITVCIESFLVFIQNVVYRVVGEDSHNGWVTVENNGDLYDMPQYLFARYFDAEAFVIGNATPEEMANAKPAIYKNRNGNLTLVAQTFKDTE